MFGSNCCQSQILWAMGCNMARTTWLILPLHFTSHLYFLSLCLSIACFAINIFFFIFLYIFILQMEPISNGNLPPGFDPSTCRSVWVLSVFFSVFNFIRDWQLIFLFSLLSVWLLLFFNWNTMWILQGNKKTNLGDAQSHTNAGAKITVNNIILVQFLFLPWSCII